jgi:hypothetical protein
MSKLITWITNKFEDLAFWFRDRPLTKIWQGIKDRFDAVIFCLLMLVVGIYSPETLRSMMLDAIIEQSKK